MNFSESTPSNATNKENMPLDVNQETITPRVSHFAAELNVENLCGKQTTQLKVLIVNPNGRIDSQQYIMSSMEAAIRFLLSVSLEKYMRDHLTFD